MEGELSEGTKNRRRDPKIVEEVRLHKRKEDNME
jgi:hypothetical protein